MTVPAEFIPLPPVVSDATYSDMTSRELDSLDDEGRYVVRQMLAKAYRCGYADGRRVTQQEHHIDDYVKREQSRQTSESETAA